LSNFTTRPVIMGTHGVVAAGHYLATPAGLRMLELGGNAIDAAASIGFALSVLEPHMNSIGGEVPVLLYSAKEERTVAISGQGPAPRAATIEWFESQDIDMIPGDGLLPAVVPSVVGTWIEALEQFGTLSLKQVLTSAIELAEEGFPIHHILAETIEAKSKRFIKEWPTTARTFLPGGKLPEEGQVLRQKELAKTLRRLVDAEGTASQTDRIAGLEAARREFYEGYIARKLVDFCKGNEFLDASGSRHSGLLSYEDLAAYRARIEAPLSTDYREYEVFKCGPWTQGPVFLQQLNVLESYDLPSMGFNSPDYIHLVVECAKLAFADREAYYGDPEFDHVPLKTLLSKQYARGRRKQIDMKHASLELKAGVAGSSGKKPTKTGDTTHLDVIDKWGNMVSATQSGAWIRDSPLVEGLGFATSTRAQMFYLDPKRNNALAPGKRPRTTLTPSLAYKNGRPYMVFGTPGADSQDQWSLQFFLNHVDFGMNLQEAIDAPSFHSLHFPSSFYPRKAQIGKLMVEGRIPSGTRADLRRRGHLVEICGDWENGRVSAISKEADVIRGAASPKTIFGNSGYAIGW
jgi:gamma-glutamyltranspeptidase / glutathione hydrolase